MTELAPELVAPAEAWLAAGAPSDAFLADNLPGREISPALAAGAVGMAAAVLAWNRHFATVARAELPSPTTEDALARLGRLALRHAPIWMRLAQPAVAKVMADAGLTGEELQAVAADYAAGMGAYVHQTSAEAVLAGFREQLRRGSSPTLAWLRALQGYGLDERRLRSWLNQQATDGPITDLISNTALRALDKAMLARADLLGQHEAWHARHVAKSIAWLYAWRTGKLPVGTTKRWLTAEDERVCPVCGPLHGQEMSLDAQFVLPNGQRLWAPGVHPNCRCELELVYPQTVFEKAAPGDPYDRDPDGKFARQESRTRKVTPLRLPVTERRVDPAVQAMFEQMPAEPEVPDLFAGTVPKLFDRTAGAPDLFDSPTLFEVPELFEAPTLFEAPALFAPKTTGRRKKIYIIINGALAEVDAVEGDYDPDRFLFLPVDHLMARLEEHKPSRAGEPADFDKQYQVGDLVKFSDILGQMAFEAEQRHENVPLYIDVFEQRAGDQPGMLMHRLDDFYASADDAEQSDETWMSDIDSARESLYYEIQGSPDRFLDAMDDDDVDIVYGEAGLGAVAAGRSPARLRADLLDVLSGMDELDGSTHTAEMLKEAFIYHAEELDPSLLEVRDRVIESAPEALRQPQVFTFPETQRVDYRDLGGARMQPFIPGGTYVVTEVKLHPNTPDTHHLHGGHYNPRISFLREVRLSPKRVDPDEVE